ncbi:hypothetical protein ACFSJ3_16610 [Corallincola platygyrae]|uniref:Uncharacterized protein n=1 Tax=Corallincola platygyrae TaxID=1193278 RepID=A0ABW4XR28_9GAMM
MNKQEFVDAIRLVVSKSAIEATVESMEAPPGRRPPQELVERSEWYRSLSENDRLMVSRAVSESVHEAVFGFLCVLDGVRSISDIDETNQLTLNKGMGKNAIQLNSEDGEYLHDLYNAV